MKKFLAFTLTLALAFGVLSPTSLQAVSLAEEVIITEAPTEKLLTEEVLIAETPTEEALNTEVPTVDASITEEPTVDASITEEPTVEATITEAPTVDASPTEDTPAISGPAWVLNGEVRLYGTLETLIEAQIGTIYISTEKVLELKG